MDFYFPAKKLIIEIDGPEHSKKENEEYDKVREIYFEGLNIKVLRFTNLEVETKTEKVIEKIKKELWKTPPSLPLSKGVVSTCSGVFDKT